jgi:hypothetical protein
LQTVARDIFRHASSGAPGVRMRDLSEGEE